MILLLSALFTVSSVASPHLGEAYPEGSQTPRYLTPAEKRHIQKHPIVANFRGLSNQPTGAVECVAEYEPMEAIMLAWEGWSSIVAEMAAHITTTGEAEVLMVVDNSNEQSSVISMVNSFGGDANKVRFIVRATDTIWIRDYGPRYIYENGCRAIVDHTYNRPRPNDNALNSYLPTALQHGYYEIPLVHGGGNFHLNSMDQAWSTELIVNENPSLTESQIRTYWADFQNLNVTITDALPTSIDYTQHIDMWMCWASDTTCLVSDWPNDSGSTQDQICDTTASTLEFLGYTVVRIPARSTNWTHYTYANAVICNDLVLVPSYSNTSIAQHNAQAVAAWEKACPSKTIVPIPCEDIVSAAGVMHCICMHIPKHSGGAIPTTYLQAPQNGEVLQADQTFLVHWLADDDEGIVSVDLAYSLDGGNSWSTIANQISHSGSYLWAVPDTNTSDGLVKITAIDGDLNTVSDVGNGFFSIVGGSVAGDVNGDGIVNITDILSVMGNWGPCTVGCSADLNGDGDVNVTDLLIVIENW